MIGADLTEVAGLRVLAAEDHPANRFVLTALLSQVGIVPVMAVNGAEAVRAWEASRWDLVLMDIQMPVLDGLQATKEIRDRERALGLPRTRIVAVTAHSSDQHAVAYLAAGLDEYLSKPIDADRLFDVVGSAAARR